MTQPHPGTPKLLNSGIRPDSWVGWSHVQNYEQLLLPPSWKDRLTWKWTRFIRSHCFSSCISARPNCWHLPFLPAAKPLDLSMCWKVHVTPFSSGLYTHILPLWQVLERWTTLPAAQLHLKETPVVVVWYRVHLQNTATSLHPLEARNFTHIL